MAYPAYPRPVPPRTHRLIFAALSAGLLLAHLDPWNAGPRDLVFGWLPWDLAYHLLWMAAACALIFYMTSRAVWPEDDAP